jgi:hypothetical protein
VEGNVVGRNGEERERHVEGGGGMRKEKGEGKRWKERA